MDLIKWFNVKEKKHLLAYHELCLNGVWPEDFLPLDIEIPINWQIILKDKIVDEYIKEKLIEYRNVQMKKCFKKILTNAVIVSESNKYSSNYKDAWKVVMKIIKDHQ